MAISEGGARAVLIIHTKTMFKQALTFTATLQNINTFNRVPYAQPAYIVSYTKLWKVHVTGALELTTSSEIGMSQLSVIYVVQLVHILRADNVSEPYP